MLHRTILTIAAAAIMLFVSATASADTVVLAGRAGTGVTAQIRNYSLTFDSVTGRYNFTFSIYNTSTAPSTTGTITNIGFNLPGDRNVYGFEQMAGDGNYYLREDVRVNATGLNTTLDAALLTSQGNNFNGGMTSNGIDPGNFATFRITGDFAGLTADQIANSITARFQNVGANGDSDVADYECTEPTNLTPTSTGNPTTVPCPAPVPTP